NSPRIEFTNPTYAQPYCYNISGESIIRQFTYGIKKIRSHFSDVEFVTYSVEEPCFTSSLPQILSHLGYKYASLKCPDTCWGGYTAAYGGETVNWISSDGSSILTSPRYECEELQENSVWQTTAWANHDNYVEACRKAGIAHPVGMCFQDAGWKNGPWVGYGKRARNQSQYVTWREYFEMLGIEKSEHDYHFTQEDVRPALMWGSQVLQRIAQQVRHSENIIPVAEKFATMAYLLDDDYTTPQAEIDEAWRTLMLAQHHDSWIVPYNNLHDKGSWANWIARWTAGSDRRACGVIADAQQTMAGKAWSSGNEATLRVWNTQGVKRREVMTVAIPEAWQGYDVAVYNAEGKRVESAADMTHLSFVADAPSFGYTSYRLQKLNDRVATDVANQDDCIENDMYCIRVDASRGGAISEFIVKQGGKNFDYVDKNAERMMGELYGHFYDQQKFRSSTESPARVTVGRRGDLEQWLLIEGTISSHPFSQRITIRKGSPAIDIDLKIDWQHNEGIGEYRQRDSFSANERACY
ncbi:MAG: alpha-mannosidase, partial [Alistipes sp.]|nr:alpha-mannosidase [Alistipes sp.]